MTKVRKENGYALEYVCPECGATFEEGSDSCEECGLEFDWTEEMEYLCPECGTIVDRNQSRCPGCGAKFSTGEGGDLIIEYEPDAEPPTVDELLEMAINEVRRRPRVAKEVDEPSVEVKSPRPKQTGSEELGSPAPPRPKVPTDKRSEALSHDVMEGAPRLFPGGFTLIGLVFVILAVLALLFTIVMARYDTWIQGAAEESMGDNQRMMFMAGFVAFTIFLLVAIWDLLRTPRGLRGKTAR